MSDATLQKQGLGEAREARGNVQAARASDSAAVACSRYAAHLGPRNR